MFFLFTSMMLGSHVYLIITGKTTVESFKARDQNDAEVDILNKEYGFWWHNLEKRKARKHWAEQWGNVPVDARWRAGSAMEQWRQEMGNHWLGWICEY